MQINIVLYLMIEVFLTQRREKEESRGFSEKKSNSNRDQFSIIIFRQFRKLSEF